MKPIHSNLPKKQEENENIKDHHNIIHYRNISILYNKTTYVPTLLYNMDLIPINNPNIRNTI